MVAVGVQIVGTKTQGLGDLQDGAQGRLAGDLDIRSHRVGLWEKALGRRSA